MQRHLAQLNYEIRYLRDDLSVLPDAPPATVQFGDFSCVVTADELVATPSGDYQGVDQARILLEPYLEAWAAKSELFDSFPISFRFQGQRYDYPPREDGVVYGEARAVFGITVTAKGHVQ